MIAALPDCSECKPHSDENAQTSDSQLFECPHCHQKALLYGDTRCGACGGEIKWND